MFRVGAVHQHHVNNDLALVLSRSLVLHHAARLYCFGAWSYLLTLCYFCAEAFLFLDGHSCIIAMSTTVAWSRYAYVLDCP